MCYIKDEKLEFQIRVNRNGVGFTRIYFTEPDRTILTDTDCPVISANAADDQFDTIFTVDPTTDLLDDGRSCGIETIETGKQYQFRMETEIEFERDRIGDIAFCFNCHADFAASDVVSTMYTTIDPDVVVLNPPIEDLRLLAVTTTGGDLPTTTLGDGTVIPTINIGEDFALELFFETLAHSSARGATCTKLYVSVDDTYATFVDHLIDSATGCPINEFWRPATGLILAQTPAADSYRYRTGAIQAAKYAKQDIPEATDILYVACEAEFCRQDQDPHCDDRCSTAAGKKRRAVEYLKRSEFRKLVKRQADGHNLVTLKIKVTEEAKDISSSSGVSMLVVWSLVGVACVILAVFVIFLLVFCRARNGRRMKSDAYKHHVDQSSISSSDVKTQSTIATKIRY